MFVHIQEQKAAKCPVLFMTCLYIGLYIHVERQSNGTTMHSKD